MRQIRDFYSLLTRILVTAAALFCVFLIGFLDYLSGIKIDLSVFYFIPIAMTAIYVRRKAAVSLAIVSTFAVFICNWRDYSDAIYYAYVNTGMHLISFIMIAVVFSYIRQEKQKIQVLNRELEKVARKIAKREASAR